MDLLDLVRWPRAGYFQPLGTVCPRAFTPKIRRSLALFYRESPKNPHFTASTHFSGESHFFAFGASDANFFRRARIGLEKARETPRKDTRGVRRDGEQPRKDLSIVVRQMRKNRGKMPALRHFREIAMLFRIHDPVSQPAHRHDNFGRVRVVLNLGAQPFYVHVQGLGISEPVFTPHPVHDLSTSEHSFGVT